MNNLDFFEMLLGLFWPNFNTNLTKFTQEVQLLFLM
jgi:hypothetical protein